MKTYKTLLYGSALLFSQAAFSTTDSALTIDIQQEITAQLQVNLAQLNQPAPKMEIAQLIEQIDRQFSAEIQDGQLKLNNYKVVLSE